MPRSNGNGFGRNDRGWRDPRKILNSNTGVLAGVSNSKRDSINTATLGDFHQKNIDEDTVLKTTEKPSQWGWGRKQEIHHTTTMGLGTTSLPGFPGDRHWIIPTFNPETMKTAFSSINNSIQMGDKEQNAWLDKWARIARAGKLFSYSTPEEAEKALQHIRNRIIEGPGSQGEGQGPAHRLETLPPRRDQSRVSDRKRDSINTATSSSLTKKPERTK